MHEQQHTLHARTWTGVLEVFWRLNLRKPKIGEPGQWNLFSAPLADIALQQRPSAILVRPCERIGFSWGRRVLVGWIFSSVFEDQRMCQSFIRSIGYRSGKSWRWSSLFSWPRSLCSRIQAVGKIRQRVRRNAKCLTISDLRRGDIHVTHLH